MKGTKWGRALLPLWGVPVVLLAGCATRAPDFHGRWHAVNHYDDAPEAIPLAQAYVFAPAPMDGTLKNMLTRWARDSRLTLSYLASSDFTLYRDVAELHTSSLPQAVATLNSAYAAEGISIALVGNQIVVRAAGAPAMPVPAASP